MRKGPAIAEAGEASQRIDKWLTYARFAKTRGVAEALVAGGKVRINRDKVSDGARHVRPGDIVTVRISKTVHVVRVLGLSAARVGAKDTPSLYERIEAP
ncbi:MAG: S4 domain-containing protein [Pseudomonadota bacterium]